MDSSTLASLFPDLALAQLAESRSCQSWDQNPAIMERIHRGDFSSKDGQILQRTKMPAGQNNLLKRFIITPLPIHC